MAVYMYTMLSRVDPKVVWLTKGRHGQFLDIQPRVHLLNT